MTEKEIFKRLVPVITTIRPLFEEEITLDADIRDTLGFDSLDLIDMSLVTETTFNIKINREKLEQVRTVQDWITFIAPIINAK